MAVFSANEFSNHEQIVFCRDAATGLKAIIAVHNTALGPAAGGCRMWPYASEDEALWDVMRLAKGMSYKNALAGLPLGGGKSVIIGDPATDKTPALLRSFAGFVDRLGGTYYTAEDVGISTQDANIMAERSDYIFGISARPGGAGDPSPYTARGTFQGIRAGLQHCRGTADLRGIRVAVQGIGNVGGNLCRLLHEAGAALVIGDVHAGRARAMADMTGAEVVPADEVLFQEADVIAPCALGAVLNDESIPLIKAPLIAGAANNQLAEDRHGTSLMERGITYLPDYLINAGGVLSASCDIFKSFDARAVTAKVDALYDRSLEILRRADAERRPPHEVADSLAEEIIEARQFALSA